MSAAFSNGIKKLRRAARQASKRQAASTINVVHRTNVRAAANIGQDGSTQTASSTQNTVIRRHKVQAKGVK